MGQKMYFHQLYKLLRKSSTNAISVCKLEIAPFPQHSILGNVFLGLCQIGWFGSTIQLVTPRNNVGIQKYFLPCLCLLKQTKYIFPEAYLTPTISEPEFISTSNSACMFKKFEPIAKLTFFSTQVEYVQHIKFISIKH